MPATCNYLAQLWALDLPASPQVLLPAMAVLPLLPFCPLLPLWEPVSSQALHWSVPQLARSWSLWGIMKYQAHLGCRHQPPDHSWWLSELIFAWLVSASNAVCVYCFQQFWILNASFPNLRVFFCKLLTDTRPSKDHFMNLLLTTCWSIFHLGVLTTLTTCSCNHWPRKYSPSTLPP